MNLHEVHAQIGEPAPRADPSRHTRAGRACTTCNGSRYTKENRGNQTRIPAGCGRARLRAPPEGSPPGSAREATPAPAPARDLESVRAELRERAAAREGRRPAPVSFSGPSLAGLRDRLQARQRQEEDWWPGPDDGRGPTPPRGEVVASLLEMRGRPPSAPDRPPTAAELLAETGTTPADAVARAAADPVPDPGGPTPPAAPPE